MTYIPAQYPPCTHSGPSATPFDVPCSFVECEGAQAVESS